MTTEQTTINPTTSKAASKTTSPRRLSDVAGIRNPDSDAVLASIEDTDVTVVSCESDQMQGRRRKYWLSKIILDDGRSFSVAGKAVAQPFSYLAATDYPIIVTFYREPSDFEPGTSYWAVK